MLVHMRTVYKGTKVVDSVLLMQDHDSFVLQVCLIVICVFEC